MKKLLLLLMTLPIFGWAISKPMESIENYNVLMVHGAYGHEKGFLDEKDTNEAYYAATSLENGATLGAYDNEDRIVVWTSKNVLEESGWKEKRDYARNSYVYNWRSFSNPANSSLNNAYELGDRTWKLDNAKYKHRRALVEEAQEVKAFYVAGKDTSHGQVALDSVRQNPDLYRQLASRYILIGHSMGGVVSREYVQGNFYNGDVDKIITLDSPHEGTGALNMLIEKSMRKESFGDLVINNLIPAASMASGLSVALFGMKSPAPALKFGIISLAVFMGIEELGNALTYAFAPEIYYYDDPLVHYVDPKQTGPQTIDTLNKLPYAEKIDSLPMFRILASQHGMTFSDPELTFPDWFGAVRYVIPDNLTFPFANYWKQLSGTGDMSACHINAWVSAILGFAGMPMQDNGSNIVPAASSEGRNVGVLNDPRVDVKREYFNAAPAASGEVAELMGDFTSVGDLSFVLEAATTAMLALDAFAWSGVSTAAKIALGVGTGAAVLAFEGAVLSTGIYDLAKSHSIPLQKNYLDDMKVLKNSFSPIGSSAGSSYTPYLMEDFLYEKPFVNLALNDSKTMDSLSKMNEDARESSTLNRSCFYGADADSSTQLCEVGLYGADGKTVDMARERNYSAFKGSPLKFSSSSDWEKFGVKVDRWERVDGLKPDGSENPGGVPIRHVERYNVPAITVDNWIEKYSFVVDDLMPHRLRQIRMNFNFNEEIAWECDIAKPENASDACEVYKRKAGESWPKQPEKHIPHPVKKNGQFDFVPADYGYNNLLAIQKDNQNTVTISTVNKIGLSNTQRFYYLYKATDNVLKSNWPVRDVVLNDIEGFEAFASVTNYQGFKVDSAYDVIYVNGDIGNGIRLRMESIPHGEQDLSFLSRQFADSTGGSDSLDEGQYAWQFKAFASDLSGTVDSSQFYNALFSVDRTAPRFSLRTDNGFVNPDSAFFLVRYKWADTLHGPDIRAMRWTLEGGCTMSAGDSLASDAVCSGTVELPAMHDVAANEFAVAWDKVPQGVRNALEDGLYRVKAYAVDYAVPNRVMYDSVNALVGRIMQSPGSLKDADWKFVGDSSGILNDTAVYALFRIDRTPPVIKDILPVAASAVDTAGMSFATGMVQTNSYAGLSRPKNTKGYPIVSGDSLLEISYKVVEKNSGVDTAVVLVSWNFEHVDEARKVDRAGDSVYVVGDSALASWKEASGLRLVDGIYKITATARDLAGNKSNANTLKLVRVDRTAPKIVSLTSGHEVYPEGNRNFIATVDVNQSNDVDSNRTGMYCHYRVLGGDADNKWRPILRNGRDSLLTAASVEFAVDSFAVGLQNGKRYLEVVCLDAAGNAAVRTDLFHVGYRSPNIVYPVADKTESSEKLIPIVGIAPPSTMADSSSAVYRLQYRKCSDTEWKNDKIDVVAANRRPDTLHNYSRIAQSVEGVLGYLKNDFTEEDSICIELAVASCFSCNDWKTDVSKIVVSPYEEDSLEVRPTVVFDVSKNTFVAGSDSVAVSLRLEGAFNSSYLLRVNAEDAKGVGLKDWSVEKAWRNPYYGVPPDSAVQAISSGVWFYQDTAGTYHLQWKGVGDSLKMQIMYDSATVREACEGPGSTNVDVGCSVETMTVDFSAVAELSKTYLEDYPEWVPPSHVDKAMKLSSSSGHIVIDATSAFRIAVDGNYDTDANIPVYFGNNGESGFYWVKGHEESQLSPLSTGWTVNPQGYGLNFVWNGLSETNAFPAEGLVKLVAEVTENTTNSPHVHVETKTLNVELPALEVSLAQSQPDFLVLGKSIDNGDSVAFSLDSMEIRYGIRNKDAKVWIEIRNSKGEVVTTLLNAVEHRAYASDSAYSVRWSGKNAFDTPETAEGAYTVLIKAVPNDSSKSASASATFNVKYAESMQKMTPDNPKNASGPSIYVSEAEKDAKSDGKYRYEPVADYLLQTSLSGWYLPESLRDSLNVNVVASGRQKPLGFDAEHFSLGILRQRDTLDLVILIDLDEKLDENGCSSGKPTYDGESHHATKKNFVRFYRGRNELNSLRFADSVGFTDNGRAFSIHEQSILNVYAFPAFYQDSSKEALLRDSANALVKFSYPMPLPTREHYGDTAAFWGAWEDSVDVGCVADSSGDCSYDSDKYNPEARLFKMEIEPLEVECKMIPGPSLVYFDFEKIGLQQCPAHKTYFYSDLGQVRNGSGCYNNDMGFERIGFKLHLGIPDFYWDAGFGYDNLVNRTIRFDATNATIYGDTSGYWPAIEKEAGLAQDSRRNSYFDGSQWAFDKKYGRVTAFETQHLPFFKAGEMDVPTNTFLFPGEIPGYESPSHFTVKFYGKDVQSHFVADIFARNMDGSLYKERLTSLTEDSLQTPMLKHGDADFYVSFNKVVSETDEFFGDSSGYWIDFPLGSDGIPANNDSIKYYAAASRIHYFVDDYADTVWKEVFSDGAYFKNLSNTASGSVNLINSILDVDPNSVEELSLDTSVFEASTVNRLKVALDPEKYKATTHKFYSALGKETDGTAGLDYSLDFYLNGLDESLYSFVSDTLYVNAQEWTGDTILRRTECNLEIPERSSLVHVEMDKLYTSNSWEKEVVVDDVRLTFLDSSAHSHFDVKGDFPAASDVQIQYKDEVGDRRIPEYVELRAYLKGGETYSLAYLNGNKFYVVPEASLDASWKNGIAPAKSGDYRLGWFNVNKLQGNTQFLLTWGGAENTHAYYYSTFDMLVGKSVAQGERRTVSSPLEDVSVTFPKNSLMENKDITVRTIDAKDYPFEVFNGLALKGPIVEVLPSMTFENNDALPRIQMKISRDEMNAMHTTPETIRLYKVDFDNKEFVPLDNALYGFLKADGSPVMDGVDSLKCDNGNRMTDARCAGNDTLWAYLLISAETRTFSVFTAMDSAVAETPNFSVTVLPKIAATVNRTVRVDGLSKYRLFVDDDSLWSNRGDTTPPVEIEFTADSNGFAQITLPSRGNAIDTSYVFVAALGEPDSNGVSVELPAAPVFARALTVNEEFACSVPQDSLWLGLDNGYMAYGATCTHPGYGVVSLYSDGKLVSEIRGEIPDAIMYDGSKTLGASRIGKIAPGVYESRYLGVSALGKDMQMAGPLVYTDSARPSVENFAVHDSAEVLDRIFTVTADVYDYESGVAHVAVTPVFGSDTLRVVSMLPDSTGHVSATIRLSRKQLSECDECQLTIGMRVEDYGHNHFEKKFVSEKLFPYPSELALWYPAREGSGKIVHEFVGTGHDLSLSMFKPWLSDAGLYFYHPGDRADGSGVVDFGESSAYSFEARIKRGNDQVREWRRVLGFDGLEGLNIELQMNGNDMRLVEGNTSWTVESILPESKTWFHTVVTVDSAEVNFYIDGRLAKTLPVGDAFAGLERQLEGVFSMGSRDGVWNFVGNIADVRMYRGALTATEVEELSKPVTDAGEISDVIVVAVRDMDVISGFASEFSCSVAGNKYLVSGDSATLTMTVSVDNSAEYNVVLYARSATVGNVDVSIGEKSMQAGAATVHNTWRAASLSGVALALNAGTHALTLKVPAGIQIGGIALTTADIPASMIAWGVSTSDKVAGVGTVDTARKVKSFLRYEGYPETSTLRPRIRLKNVSSEPVNGFSVRYYFRGEDASQANAERYWPNNISTFPAVHSESANTGYVEWKFAETIPVAGTVFGGDGPHFGVYNSDYTPWDASDDPSYVGAESGVAVDRDGFYEDAGIVVLDKDNNLIGGSCAEMEDPISLEAKVLVFAADVRGDNQASEIHVKVENTGNVALKNFDVRYYFFVEEGFAPAYDIYDASACSSVTMESLGFGRWQVNVHCDKSLAPGKEWLNPVKFVLYLPGWADVWNAGDDPSHDGLGTTVREAHGICIFDSTGAMIYGDAPEWILPSPEESDPDSTYNVDFGYHAPGNPFPVERIPEGLVVTLDNWVYVELSLVTAMGVPVKSVFSGSLAPGEQLVRVDWTGIDMNRTYLMFKVNGSIKSTSKLSSI